MGHRRGVVRGVMLLVVAVCLLSSSGCTYLVHRAEDATDMVDLGLTFSARPGFALYMSNESILGTGYSNVDGYLLGMGGGLVGLVRHAEKCWGLVLYGHERQAWGEFDLDDPSTFSQQYVGLAGLIHKRFSGSRPDYMPSCIHSLHLGWFGLVANLRYTQILDFILGWTTLDIANDDGKRLGEW
ncbi:MAG: hypothetical protein ACYS8L_09785 [Planctomycetota bacterium]